MSSTFTFEAQGSRVLFGAGSLSHLEGELDRLSARRVMVVSTPSRTALVDSVRKWLASRVVEIFDRAVAHVPEDVAKSSLEVANDGKIDCILTLGGSSSIGVAKALALTLPV